LFFFCLAWTRWIWS